MLELEVSSLKYGVFTFLATSYVLSTTFQIKGEYWPIEFTSLQLLFILKTYMLYYVIQCYIANTTQ